MPVCISFSMFAKGMAEKNTVAGQWIERSWPMSFDWRAQRGNGTEKLAGGLYYVHWPLANRERTNAGFDPAYVDPVLADITEIGHSAPDWFKPGAEE
jgi:hypothetical protein